MPLSRPLRFGVFEIDPTQATLTRDGVRVPLQDLPFRLLGELVSRPGQLVSREELRAALWDEDVFVDFDTSLNTAVSRVREALGDPAGRPVFVETVPRRGYRFLATVEGVGEVTVGGSRAGSEPVVWVLVAVLLAGGIGWWLGRGGVALETRVAAPTAATSEARVELLRARHFADLRSREGLEKAIASYQSALASDPGSPSGHSGLASSYLLLGVYDYWRPSEAFPPARRMVERALELDSSSAEAHIAAGMLAAIADWDWLEAERNLERALELDPVLVDAHLWRGVLLTVQSRFEEGIASTRRALELEPTSPVINTMLAWQFFLSRQQAEALEQTRRTVEIAPDYFDAWDNLKWMHIAWGDEAEAIEAWRKAEFAEYGRATGTSEALETYGLQAVIRESVRRRLEATPAPGDKYRSPYDLVIELCAIGEVETALDFLERSFAERETDLVAMAVDPRLDPLRDLPRFEEMQGRLRLPDPSGASLGTH